MNFVLKMMNFVLKMVYFVFQMMYFNAHLSRRATDLAAASPEAQQRCALMEQV